MGVRVQGGEVTLRERSPPDSLMADSGGHDVSNGGTGSMGGELWGSLFTLESEGVWVPRAFS